MKNNKKQFKNYDCIMHAFLQDNMDYQSWSLASLNFKIKIILIELLKYQMVF